jgi:undecaprenyl phosphate-alpha-L-ara4N flippase subunit ArnE
MNWLALTEIAIVVVLGTAGQLALKRGLSASGSGGPRALLLSPWMWTWFVSYVVCTAMWILALRSIPLSQAFPLLGSQFALIPIASAWFLDEHVSRVQWLGVAVIAVGTALVGQS